MPADAVPQDGNGVLSCAPGHCPPHSVPAANIGALPIPGGASVINFDNGSGEMLAARDKSAVQKNKTKSKYKKNKDAVTPEEREALSDARLASMWIAKSVDIPDSVPEDMLLAGYSYSDVLIALALMDYGASLNELLEQRQRKRWTKVASEVGIEPSELPSVIRDLMIHNRAIVAVSKPLHFMPDVRSGLNKRLRLPAFSATVPDPVSVTRFRLSKNEVANVRAVLDDTNSLTREMLLKPAGRSLLAADWLIAAALAKYKPFPLETILACRTGDVLEWGDIASIFSVDPLIFTSGPLAPAYAVLTKTDADVALPGLVKTDYPEGIPADYSLDRVSAKEAEALRWLMSMYYKEDTNERDLLQARNMSIADQGIALALARMSRQELSEVLAKKDGGYSWAEIVLDYELDMTGEEVLGEAILLRSPKLPKTGVRN